MKKMFFLLLLVAGLFSLALAKNKDPQEKSGFDVMVEKYFMVDVNKSNHTIFYKLNQPEPVSFYPNDTQVANLWNASLSLNPWIKNEKKIKAGTIIIWNTTDIPIYRRNVITRLKKGENPLDHAFKLLTSPFCE